MVDRAREREAGGGPEQRHQAPAIVIQLDSTQGLQTARILASRGVPVVGIASNPQRFECRTRVCQSIEYVNTKDETLVSLLETMGPQFPDKAVLYPCSDASVLLVSAHRERLRDCYHVMLPEHRIVEMCMDKASFYAYAQEHGLPLPTTFHLKNRADAERAAKHLTFPAVLKPNKRTPLWEHEGGGRKVHEADDAAELLSLYDRYAPCAEMLIAQEFIPGGSDSLYCCHCYIGAQADLTVTFVDRKLRQYPPHTGSGCLREECHNDVVRDQAIRLFTATGYRGLGYLEMKRDSRTGRHLIIEPNVGRPTGGCGIVQAGGVDLLYAMYCDAIGLPRPPNLEQRFVGTKWIYLHEDVHSAWILMRAGHLTLWEWLRSRQGRKAYAVLSWSDPLPFLVQFRQTLIDRPLERLWSHARSTGVRWLRGLGARSGTP